MADVLRMTPTALDGQAQRLLDAERAVAPVGPVSAALPGLGIDDAYAIQTAGRALRQRRGARVVGHKIGLTSAAMQQQLGVDEPDYGYLLDEMVMPDGARLELGELIAPRVEGEIAFILQDTLSGPDVDAEDVLAATAAVAVALEVIDSRIADWKITLVDTIADNASSARAVVGAPVPLGALDLAALELRMTVGDEEVVGRGDAVLGHPAISVAWLARALHAQGEALEAGELVLSGALARALPIAPGVTASATIDGLGTVRAVFEGAA